MKNINKKFLISLGYFLLSMNVVASNIEPVKNFNSYPLAKEATSISRGGTLNDKSANEDGIGTVLIGGIGNETNDINNKTYNQALKNNSSTLSDTTNLKDLTINNNDLNIINNNKFVKINHINGTSCNDNNSQTINETWLNDICSDAKTNGTKCNDGNNETLNEVWTNEVCTGELKEIGEPCSDGDNNTIYDKYDENLNCVGKKSKFLSINGLNTNECNYNFPCKNFASVNIKSGDNVVIKSGNYNTITQLNSGTHVPTVLYNLHTKSNVVVYGEDFNTVITMYKGSSRDMPLFAYSSNATISNLRFNYNTGSINANYIISLVKVVHGFLNLNNITFNITGKYSTNYNENSVSTGFPSYNNCQFNGGAKLTNYNFAKYIINLTSEYTTDYVWY